MKYLYLFLFSSSFAFGQHFGLDVNVNMPTGAFADAYHPGIGANLFWTFEAGPDDFVKLNVVSFRRWAANNENTETITEDLLALPLPLGVGYYKKLKGNWYASAEAQMYFYSVENNDGDAYFGLQLSNWRRAEHTAINTGLWYSPFTDNWYLSTGLSVFIGKG